MALLDRNGNPVRSGSGAPINTRTSSSASSRTSSSSSNKPTTTATTSTRRPATPTPSTAVTYPYRSDSIVSSNSITNVEEDALASRFTDPSTYSGTYSARPFDNPVSRSTVEGSNAYYPTGYESVGQAQIMPTDLISSIGMFNTLNGSIVPTVTAMGKALLGQSKYGMNAEAAERYASLVNDSKYKDMTEAELVQEARRPQMEKQLPHAFIGTPTTDAQRQAVARGEVSPTGQIMSNSYNGPTVTAQPNNSGGGNTMPSGVADNGQYFDGGYTGSAVDKLSQARAPRGMEFSDIYGTTRFNPNTGQMEQVQAPEFEQFQQGLLGQLQGAQQAYQSFDPNDAASEYLRGVNAIREPMREQQADSKLSQLIRSGKLGSTVGTQALAQLESEQENQRFNEAVQATQYGTQMQDRMLANQAGMFGLTSQVADQQFKPYQQALASVPMLQEIYGFAQEPAFQAELAQQGINAQRSANNSNNMWNVLGTVAKTDVGQDFIGDVFNVITGNA